MLELTLRGTHRDTFKIVPPGAENDPGQWIYLPIEEDGVSSIQVTASQYTIHVRPAYTDDFIKVDALIANTYSYIRTLNPDISSDGIYDLTIPGVVLDMVVETAAMLDIYAPYIRSETITIRVELSTPGMLTSSQIDVKMQDDTQIDVATFALTNTTDSYLEFKLDMWTGGTNGTFTSGLAIDL